jgi:hypothetical protein
MNVGQETSGIAKTACIERGSPWENCLSALFFRFLFQSVARRYAAS